MMKSRFNHTWGALLVSMATLSVPVMVQAGYMSSLVSYWPMDETDSGVTVVEDATDNANHGTLRDGGSASLAFAEVNGPVLNAAGPTINSVQKNAAELDGDNDVLMVSDSATMDFDKTRGTISMWLKTDINDRQSILRTASGGASPYQGPSLEKTGSTYSHRVFFTPNVDESAYFMAEHDPVPDVWEHYVFVWDYTEADSGDAANPNRVKCWVNGVAQANHTAGGGSGDSGYATAPTATGDWVFGQRFLENGYRPFDGEMAEIAIFDTDISTSDVTSLYNNGVTTLVGTDNPSLASNLVGYWDFSEGTGTSIADDSTNSNTMICSEPAVDFPVGNGPLWTVANSTGKPGYISRALLFDGTDDAVVVPDSTSLDFTKDQGTIVMWAYFNGGVPRTGIIGDSTGEMVAQISSSGRMAFESSSDSSNLFLVPTATTQDSWVHLAFVFDKTQTDSGDATAPNKVKIYMDGVEQANYGSSYNPDVNWTTTVETADWTIGRRHDLADTDNPRWLDGQLADVAIFDEPLSVTDIQDIVANGVQAFAFADTTPPVSSASITDEVQVGATVLVDFTASDDVAVDYTALWVKTPSSASFVDTGLTETGTSGQFSYTAADGNGIYQFYTIATDTSSNAEAAPVAQDDEITVSLTENSAVPVPFDGVNTTRVFPMEAGGLNVEVSFAVITVDGSLTISRVEGDSAPGSYLADRLIGQHWVITSDGSLAGQGATLVFIYDEALLGSGITEGEIDIVIADDSGMTVYSGGDVVVDTVANTITVTNITGFSDWYAGNASAPVNAWMELED